MKNLIYIFILLVAFTTEAQTQNCPPVAVCNSGVTINLESGGNFLLWPEDIFAGMVPDTCRSVISMQLEITDRNQNVIYPVADSILLECVDVGSDLIAVLHVSNGQETNTCWGEITIQDTGGYCESFGSDTIPIRFNWYNYNRLPRGYMTVALNGNPLEEYRDGLFIIKRSDVQAGANILELDDLGRGNQFVISTLDLVLGMRMFFDKNYTPLRALVLDADLSSSMSVNDLIFLREHILGIRNRVSEREYVTLPGDYRFDPDFDNYDFGFDPYVFQFDGDTVDQVDFNFEVFVIGDLNNTPDSLMDGRLQTRQGTEARLEFEDRFVKAGEPIDVRITARLSDENVLQGFQFAVEKAPWLSVSAENSDGLPGWMTHGMADEFRVSYASIQELRQVPFTLKLTPARSGYLSDMLRLSTTFHREAVSEQLQVLPVELAPRTGKSPEVIVSPNPFDDVLRISLPDAGPTVLELLDLTGRTLSSWQSAGSQELRLDLPELPSGVYILKLDQAGQQKMIRLIRS